MRNATLCFLLILCSAIAFGQQQPQWRTVASVVLFNQNQGIPNTAIFTPTEPGIYRLNSYFSGGSEPPNKGNGFALSLTGFDITGQPFGNNNICCALTVNCYGMQYSFNVPITVSLEPNVPVVYQVKNENSAFGCEYNVAITVEQLLPPSSSTSFAGASSGALP